MLAAMGMRVAVAGGGIYGQVIAWRLARRGHDVTVIEPRGPGNAGSGSGDRSRIVRAFYDRDCFIDSGHRSLELWARWAAELDVPFHVPCGVLYFDLDRDGPAPEAFRHWIELGTRGVRARGGIIEELEPAEAARRWPALAPGGLRRVIFEPAGGIGRAALATRTIARAALATGRVTCVPAAATAIAVEGGRAVGVALGGEALAADRVVIAAGLGGVELVRPFAGDLGIRRLPHWTSYWDVPFPGGAALALGRLPAWADLGAAAYGFPDDGESGFKMAWHDPLGEGDAPPGPEALRGHVSERFPALAGATCRALYECAYDATPDETFRIGPVPGVAGLVFVGGLSGHGYKHAPVLGEAVAALVCDEPAEVLAPYALSP
jgi:sarcosine oxidase